MRTENGEIKKREIRKSNEVKNYNDLKHTILCPPPSRIFFEHLNIFYVCLEKEEVWEGVGRKGVEGVEEVDWGSGAEEGGGKGGI